MLPRGHNARTDADTNPYSDTDAYSNPAAVADAYAIAQALCGVFRDLRRYCRAGDPRWLVSHECFRTRAALGNFKWRCAIACCRFDTERRVRQ